MKLMEKGKYKINKKDCDIKAPTDKDNTESNRTESEVERERNKVDLDTLLVEDLGQFGLYQLKTCILLCYVMIHVSIIGSEYLFTAARIRTRCRIPECETQNGDVQFAPSWILNAVPSYTNTSFDSCHRFANTSNYVISFNYSCPKEIFDRDTIEECDSYVYENKNSVVYEFNLACDEWRRILSPTVRKIGKFVGLVCGGHLADLWGRRTVLVYSICLSGIIGALRYWTYTYETFLIVGFIESMAGSLSWSTAYVLFVELLGPKYRQAGLIFTTTMLALGSVSLGILAYLFPHWKTLTLVCFLSFIPIFAFKWFLPESIRWYMTRRRFDEAEAILKDIARLNKRHLPQSKVAAFKQTYEDELAKKFEKYKNETKEPSLVRQIFRHKQMLLRAIIIPFIWATKTFVFYGLNINSVNISNSPVFDFIAVSLIEIPGYWIAFMLISRIGRRPVLMAGFWLCAVNMICLIFISQENHAAVLLLFVAGKLSAAVVQTTTPLYAAELFPTRYRSTFMSFSFGVSWIGGILGVASPAFGRTLAFILFASFSILAGGLVLVTPETLGTQLPDTMWQANEMEKQSSRSTDKT